MTQPINKHLSEIANGHLERIVKNAIDLASMLPQDIVKSCLTCGYFHEPEEMCKKFKMKPPARVIAFSCESYDGSCDVPF